jgi:hypothetical protein
VRQIHLHTQIAPEDLANAIVGDGGVENYESIFELILRVDELVGDLEFTEALHQKLGDLIQECKESWVRSNS